VVFSLGTLVSFTNKTDLHDVPEILLKMALNTINQTLNLTLIMAGDLPDHCIHAGTINMKTTNQFTSKGFCV
jgi:hypothetical protein